MKKGTKKRGEEINQCSEELYGFIFKHMTLRNLLAFDSVISVYNAAICFHFSTAMSSIADSKEKENKSIDEFVEDARNEYNQFFDLYVSGSKELIKNGFDLASAVKKKDKK